MFNTKKIAIFLIILLTFVSNFLGVSNANTILPPLAPYPTNIPTQFTPFNKTSIISWKPWTVDNSLSIGDFTPLNQTFGVRKGALIPFYSTLLPMYPNATHLQYSIKLLSLSGGSNVFVNLSCNLISIDHPLGGIFSTNPCSTGITLNTQVNNSISGTLSLEGPIGGITSTDPQYSYVPYSYAAMMQNITINYAYTQFGLQPEPVNKLAAWNSTLVVQVSIAGLEDKAFYNYLRISKGLPALDSNSFIPKQVPLNSTTTNEQLLLGPMDQPGLQKQTQFMLLYISNTSYYTNDFLDLHLSLQTLQSIRIGIDISRSILISSSAGPAITYTVEVSFPVSTDNSQVEFQLNWERIKYINFTVLNVQKNSSNDYSTINTSINTIEIPNYHYYRIINKIGVYAESTDPTWDNWVNISAHTTWNVDNSGLRNNTALLRIVAAGKQTLNQTINFSNTPLLSIPATISLFPSFTMVDVVGFFMVVLIIDVLYIKRRKR